MTGKAIRRGLLSGVACGALALGVASGPTPASSADLPAAPPLPYVSAVLSLWGGVGFLDPSGDGANVDGDFDKNSFPTFGGDARMAGDTWLLETYGSYIGGTGEDDGTPNSEGSTYFLGAAHWLMREPDRTYGLFFAADAAGHQDSDDHSVNFYPGIEGAWHRGQQHYFAQFGGTFCITGECSDTWEDGVFGRGGWRHFFSPNSKIEIDGTVAWGHFDSSDHDTTSFGWGVEYEQKLSGGNPFAFFAAYRGTYVEEGTTADPSPDTTDHALLIGLRVRLGGDLIRDYTEGASVLSLPAHHLHRFQAFPDEL